MRWRGLPFLSLLIMTGLPFNTPANASSNAEVSAGIQFSFTAPGARSLALGGAFIGLADDATAAFTNPAGLTALTRPEFSMELRQTAFTNVFTDRGEGAGLAGTLEDGSAESEIDSLSFVSFVYPRKSWTFAFFRHELANFETAFRTNGAFFAHRDPTPSEPRIATVRFLPIDSRLSLDIETIGLSAAYKLSDKFSIGLTISENSFFVSSVTRRFPLRDPKSDPLSIGGFFGPPNFAANPVLRENQSGGDQDLSFNFGLLWHLNDSLSLGAVFRQGPEFSFTAQAVNVSDPSQPILQADQSASFNVPDVYGIGMALRPSDRVTITADYTRVEYSSRTESVIDVLNAMPEVARQRAFERLTIDDGDEYRLGIEYVVLSPRIPMALRAGAWYDPDHRIRFDGEPDDSLDQRELSTLFRPGDDEIHYSLGLGLVFSERFQVDVAADFSELVDTISLSGVLRF